MTTFTYDTTVPAANNAPKNDQPVMQTNTASTANLINVDHRGFNITDGGTHRQVQLSEASSAGNGALPAGLIGATYETIYASATAGVGDIWLARGASAGIRLTGPGTPTAANSGYTFLPGGILIQWLTTAVIPSLTAVNYPIPFPSGNPPFTIQITQTGTASAADVRAFSMFSSNFVGFVARITTLGSSPSESSASFSFIAIGN